MPHNSRENDQSADYSERSVYSFRKRLVRAILRPVGLWRRKSYDIRIGRADGLPQYKKVVFSDHARAAKAQYDLELFGPSMHIPALRSVQDNEVTVDYVAGRALDRIDAGVIDKLTDFYAAIYQRGAKLKPLPQTQVLSRFEDNLHLLVDLGVLSPAVAAGLRQKAVQMAPEQVWMGFDYTDPVKNNLLLTEPGQVICAIDIKNLRSDYLIGCGVAKARRRWLDDSMQVEFFRQLQAKGAPEFESYFPFIQLFDQVQRVTNKLLAESRMKTSKKLKMARKKSLGFDDFLV